MTHHPDLRLRQSRARAAERVSLEPRERADGRTRPRDQPTGHGPRSLVLVHAREPRGQPLGTPCFEYYNGSGTTNCPRLFPELATGGVGPHDATKHHYDAGNPDPTKFPPYYDGLIFLSEFIRDMLREIRLDSQNRVFKINELLACGGVGTPASDRAGFECDNPMDMPFDEDGHFYLLTYGDGFFNINNDAGMYRWDYVKGQRPGRRPVGHTDERAGPVDRAVLQRGLPRP